MSQVLLSTSTQCMRTTSLPFFHCFSCLGYVFLIISLSFVHRFLCLSHSGVEYWQFRASEAQPNWEGLHNHNKNLYRSCSTFSSLVCKALVPRWPNVNYIGIYLTESDKFQHQVSSLTHCPTSIW